VYSPRVAAQPGANPGFPVNAVAPSTAHKALAILLKEGALTSSSVVSACSERRLPEPSGLLRAPPSFLGGSNYMPFCERYSSHASSITTPCCTPRCLASTAISSAT